MLSYPAAGDTLSVLLAGLKFNALAFFLVLSSQILASVFVFSQVTTVLMGSFSQPGLLSFYQTGGV